MRFSRHLTTPALLLAAACTMGVAHAAGSATEDPALVHARALLAKATLFDGHTDLPWAMREDKTAHGMVSKYDLRTRAPGQTDIPRLRAMSNTSFLESFQTPLGAFFAISTDLPLVSNPLIIWANPAGMFVDVFFTL